MEYFIKLKAKGMNPVYSDRMYAISQLRKLVYFLSISVNMEALTTVLFDLDIGFLDVKGNTQKEKVLFILNYCQENNMLQAFYDKVVSLQLIPYNYVNIDSLYDILDVNLKYLSFDIPDFASCKWVQTVDGNQKTLDCHHSQNYVSLYRYKQNPCEKVYWCTICGEIVEREIEHDWDEWKYISADSCDQERVCNRCGEKEKSYSQHDWSKYNKTPNGSLYRICQHCRMREYVIKGKWRGHVHWGNGTMDLWEVTFQEETFMRIPIRHIAIIEVYIDVNTEKKTCKKIVRQKGKVKVNNQQIKIKGKKLLVGTHYNLDDFDGNISDDCLTIEGIVLSKNIKGKIKLEQINGN